MFQNLQLTSLGPYIEKMAEAWQAIIKKGKSERENVDARQALKEYASKMKEKLNNQKFIDEPECERLEVLQQINSIIFDIRYEKVNLLL